MFTIKELNLLARIVDAARLEGTIYTLPGPIQEIVIVRKKLQAAIDEREHPSQQFESHP